jgi:hypothetical protein
MRTYTIELRADFVDAEKYDLLMTAVRQAAREVLTTAVMLQDKRPPQVSLQSGDMFERNKDLQVLTPEDLAGE